MANQGIFSLYAASLATTRVRFRIFAGGNVPDMTAVTAVEIHVVRKDKSVTTWTASIVGTPTVGELEAVHVPTVDELGAVGNVFVLTPTMTVGAAKYPASEGQLRVIP